MEPIAINENEILILKTNMLLHPSDMERIRTNVICQIKEGVVIIPNGFDYETRKRTEGK